MLTCMPACKRPVVEGVGARRARVDDRIVGLAGLELEPVLGQRIGIEVAVLGDDVHVESAVEGRHEGLETRVDEAQQHVLLMLMSMPHVRVGCAVDQEVLRVPVADPGATEAGRVRVESRVDLAEQQHLS